MDSPKSNKALWEKIALIVLGVAFLAWCGVQFYQMATYKAPTAEEQQALKTQENAKERVDNYELLKTKILSLPVDDIAKLSDMIPFEWGKLYYAYGEMSASAVVMLSGLSLDVEQDIDITQSASTEDVFSFIITLDDKAICSGFNLRADAEGWFIPLRPELYSAFGTQYVTFSSDETYRFGVYQENDAHYFRYIGH